MDNTYFTVTLSLEWLMGDWVLFPRLKYMIVCAAFLRELEEQIPVTHKAVAYSKRGLLQMYIDIESPTPIAAVKIARTVAINRAIVRWEWMRWLP